MLITSQNLMGVQKPMPIVKVILIGIMLMCRLDCNPVDLITNSNRPFFFQFNLV